MRIMLITAASLVVAACGGTEQTVVQTADSKVTTTGEGSYTVTTRDGSTARIESGAAGTCFAEVAATLPAHAQPYPGSTVVSNMTMEDGKGGKGRVVVLETSASLAEVTAFYDRAIAASGATKQLSLDQPGTAMRGVGIDDRSGTLIAVSDNGDKRTISLTIGNPAGNRAETALAVPRGSLQ